MAERDAATVPRYDSVLSYGFSCATAGQLQVRGLRTEAGPFDWIGGDTEALFDKALQWVYDRFETPFVTYASLSVSQPVSYDWQGYVLISEPATGLLVPHAMRKLTPAAFEVFHRALMRRAARLARMLDAASGRRVLVVTSSRTPVLTVDHWRRLRDAFRMTWPAADITLYVLAFCQEEASRYAEPGLIVDAVCRDFDMREDLSVVSPAWRYLDEASFPACLSSAEAARLQEERCRQADAGLAPVLRWWKRYFFSLRVSFRDKRRMVKLMRVAYSRGFLRFRDASPSAGRRMARFLRTRNPLWLLAVRIPSDGEGTL